MIISIDYELTINLSILNVNDNFSHLLKKFKFQRCIVKQNQIDYSN